MIWLIAAAVLLAVIAAWYAWRTVVQCPCALDLEATHEHFHAHVELEGVHDREGDEVRVHSAPTRIALGDRQLLTSKATVRQASLPRRLWTRLIGATHIADLYEVGFEG